MTPFDNLRALFSDINGAVHAGTSVAVPAGHTLDVCTQSYKLMTHHAATMVYQTAITISRTLQVRQLLDAGVNVGVGVDGSASNDCGSLLAETRLAFMLQRAQGTIEGGRSLRSSLYDHTPCLSRHSSPHALASLGFICARAHFFNSLWRCNPIASCDQSSLDQYPPRQLPAQAASRRGRR